MLQSLLNRLDARLYAIERALAFIAGLGIVSLMLFAVLSVGGRNIAGRPLPGYVDWIEQAMLFIAFLGIAFAQRDGQHIRMDVVVKLLRGKALWLFEWLTTLAILFIVLVLLYGSHHHFLRSFDFSAPLWSRDSSMDIGLPLWPTKLIVPFCFAIVVLRLGLQLIAYGHAFITNADSASGVPQLKNASELAAEEVAQTDS